MNIYHFHSKEDFIKEYNNTNFKYFNSLILYDIPWNDYGYYTKFGLIYIEDSKDIKEIGTLKITYKGYRNYRDFKSLKPATKMGYGLVIFSSDYCSIGETMEYYSNIKRVFSTNYQNVFLLLRDVAVYESNAKAFEQEPSYKGSLLRESSSIKVLNTVRSDIIISEKKETDISFQYLYHPPYSTDTSEQELFSFDFKKNEIPYRINVLIGKNGSGKTQLLKSISESLSGITGVGSSSWSHIKGRRPIIDRIITISFSAFDDVFQDRIKGRENSSVSYVYCGIHSNGQLLSSNEIADNYNMSFKIIKQKNRFLQWKNIMKVLLESEHEKRLEELIEKGITNIPLSSGQRILVSTITETIANIEPGSLILIDEFELHLHPNAISNAVRMLTTLLESFDSYSIIATHSPLIIQEIPSRYIHIMNRTDNTLSVYNPTLECFGENITNITDEVFGVLDNESNYKTVLKKLSKKHTFEEILNMFNDELAVNAMIYLNTCYRDGEIK